MGVVVINNTAKLKPFNDKVKFLQWQLLTLVLTFFKLFFIHVLWIRNFVVCLHHRNDAVPNKHHKIMKKQYTTFENIGYSVVLLAMFFIGSFAILSVYKLLSLLLGFDA